MLRKTANLINGVLGIILLLLVIRFFMEIFLIGEGTEFAHIIYSSTTHLRDPLLPAYDWLGAMESESAAFITFMTMVIYTTVFWLASSFLMTIDQNKIRAPKN